MNPPQIWTSGKAFYLSPIWFKNIFDLKFLSHILCLWLRNLPFNAEFVEESWYVAIRQRCFYGELFKLGGRCLFKALQGDVCERLSQINPHFLKGAGRGSWSCALCTPKRSLSLDFSLPNKTLEWPWDEHKPTPSHILHLKRNGVSRLPYSALQHVDIT